MYKNVEYFFILVLTLIFVMTIGGLIVDITGLEPLLHNRSINLLFYMVLCGIAYWLAEVIKKLRDRKCKQRDRQQTKQKDQ